MTVAGNPTRSVSAQSVSAPVSSLPPPPTPAARPPPARRTPTGASLCVVGDLHGQLEDLLYIFRHHGFPSPSRPYLFNGDFVDRGPKGIEVATVLFAWQQVYPGAVLLNRGNHEVTPLP